MPELPEVETICRDLEESILNQKITSVVVRNFKLRHPIPKTLAKNIKGQKIEKISRRGKYILLEMKSGTLIIHLGMSGNLYIRKGSDFNLTPYAPKHEHVNINFDNNLAICYKDPRRFGAVLWTTKDPLKHRLLKNLGTEPLTKEFTAKYLFASSRKKTAPIKQFIMDNNIVTGIGNIYAAEILFATKISPLKKANIVTLEQYKKIAKETKRILRLAIKHRGTTIRDHKDGKGKAGSFQNKLKVYGKDEEDCCNCKTKLKKIKTGGRSTVFCPECQNP